MSSAREVAGNGSFWTENAKIFKLAHSVRSHNYSKCHQPASMLEMALFGLKNTKILKLAQSVRSHNYNKCHQPVSLREMALFGLKMQKISSSLTPFARITTVNVISQ